VVSNQLVDRTIGLAAVEEKKRRKLGRNQCDLTGDSLDTMNGRF